MQKEESVGKFKKNKALIIVWVLAILSVVIYFALPDSDHIQHQLGEKKQLQNAQMGTKEYTVYFFNTQTKIQKETIFLQEGLEKEEELKALIQANVDTLYRVGTEKQKIELGNVYRDGNILYLTFNFSLSKNGQKALLKTLSDFGVKEEVKIL